MNRQERGKPRWVVSPALVLIAPAFILYVALIVVPIVETVHLSFFRWNGISPTKEYVGLANFIRAFSDPIALKALTNNLVWVLWSIVVPVFIGLFLAIMLSNAVKGSGILKVLFYMPVVLASVVVAITWEWMYNPRFGIINGLLRTIGLDGWTRAWLGESSTALPALMVANSWAYYGFCMVIFYAAIQNIDTSFYDAAKIDGANPLQTFWNVTIPCIREEMNFVILYTAIGAFKVFDLVYIMTQGGPYFSTEVVTTLMYRKAFIEDEVGYAAALAVILTLVISVVSMVFMKHREEPVA